MSLWQCKSCSLLEQVFILIVLVLTSQYCLWLLMYPHLADFVECHPGGWCQNASVQWCLFGWDGFSPPHRPVAALPFPVRAAQRWAGTPADREQCAERKSETGKLRNSADIFTNYRSYLSFLTLSCMNFCRGSYHIRRIKPDGTAAHRKTLSV